MRKLFTYETLGSQQQHCNAFFPNAEARLSTNTLAGSASREQAARAYTGQHRQSSTIRTGSVRQLTAVSRSP